MATFDFKTATPVTTGVTSSFFWFGAASQAAATPSIYTMGALTGYLTTFLSTSTLAAGTITTNSPLTLTQTWNAGGVNFKAQVVNITDTASDPESSFALYQIGGSTRINLAKSGSVIALTLATSTNTAAIDASGGGLLLASTGSVAWTSGAAWYDTADTFLRRDAANTLAQRNGTNGQTFRVYETFTDTGNYSRLEIGYGAGGVGTNYAVASTAAGTGNTRDLFIQASARVFLQSAGANNRWIVDSSGHLLAATDNTYDIGADGATRPRNVYVGTNVVAGSSLFVGTIAGPAAASLSYGGGGATPILYLSNVDGNNFGRLCFGGLTSSFPALKRNSAALEVRLADDSARAQFQCLECVSSAVYSGVVNVNNVGIYSGAGSPEGVITAPAGSLYMNSAGGTDTALYTKNSGSGNTGWVAVDNV